MMDEYDIIESAKEGKFEYIEHKTDELLKIKKILEERINRNFVWISLIAKEAVNSDRKKIILTCNEISEYIRESEILMDEIEEIERELARREEVKA